MFVMLIVMVSFIVSGFFLLLLICVNIVQTKSRLSLIELYIDFSCVLSDNLPTRIHCNIDFICFTFLHGFFITEMDRLGECFNIKL